MLAFQFTRQFQVILVALILSGAIASAADEPANFVRPEYQAFRTAGPIKIDGKLDEPSWIGAPAAGAFQFPWWMSGAKEQTIAKLLWDETNLYVACICADQHIWAQVKDRDGPVPQDDCFELMLAPNTQHPEVYFNIEWNVVGGILDNFRPNGPQKPRASKWDANGIQISGSVVGTLNDDSDSDQHWSVEVAIPFSNFSDFTANVPPRSGSSWNFNLNRHGGKTNPQFSQWSAGDTKTPNFHTPHRFGRLVFNGEPVPTGQARRFAIPPVEAITRMKIPTDLLVTPFASEPEIRQPILVKCDDRGRLWVIQYLQYPNPAGLERVTVDRWSRTIYDRLPEAPPRGPRGADKITICNDTDGDGQADAFTDFVDGLNLCTGLAFGHGGVFVLQVPYLLFYPDVDRNDVPDADPTVLLTGFGMEDAQSFANHLTWGPDGWLYGVNGSTTTCNIRGIEFQQGVWRYHPRTKQFELFCEGGGNLFGLTFDPHGQMFFTSNGGDLCMHGMQGAYYRKAFGKHGPLHNPHTHQFFVDLKKSTPVVGGPCTGGIIYSAETLPAEFSGSFLCGDFLGHTCSWWRLDPNGSTFSATRGGTLLAANDPWFGATDLCVGPDGAVYVSDFHDKRTAHPDPDADWDRSNGRVYRITSSRRHPERKVEAQAKRDAKREVDAAAEPRDASRLATNPIDLSKLETKELLELLRHPNGWFRDRARGLLAERSDTASYEQLRSWTQSTSDPSLALESLWALFVSGGFDSADTESLLQHPNEHVRLWTVRLLGERGEVSEDTAQLLKQSAIQDSSILVLAQLAATAKRLPCQVALPILFALIDRNPGEADACFPSLVWWGLESKATADPTTVVKFFLDPKHQQNSFASSMLQHLIRRYAAEGTEETYNACAKLLKANSRGQLAKAHAALYQGLTERSDVPGGIGQGELFSATSTIRSKLAPTVRSFEPITTKLRSEIQAAWEAQPNDPICMRLALVADVNAVYESLLARLASGVGSRDDALRDLSVLAECGRADCVDAVLPLISAGQPEAIQLAALRVVQRFDQPAVVNALLTAHSRTTPAVRRVILETLLERPHSALEVLRRVDRGEIAAEEIALNQLRLVSLHHDQKLDELVRKHWGRIESGTREEKLAVMRRLNNDLRVERGNPVSGKVLFKKHCAACHRLFGDGEKVGPELTNTSRNDTEYLLASLVDPSAVIRREYVASTIVTSAGQVLTGLIVEQDGGRVTIVDSKGERRQVARGEIEELHDAEKSLMPDGLALVLTPAELRDLFSYLQSQ